MTTTGPRGQATSRASTATGSAGGFVRLLADVAFNRRRRPSLPWAVGNWAEPVQPFAQYKAGPRRGQMCGALQPRTSEQLRSNNAQTPGTTRHHQGPEDEARHYESRPCTVCKTSVPGSNPGGASIFPREIHGFGLCLRPRAIAYCSEKPSNYSSLQRATSVKHCIATSCQRAISAGEEVHRTSTSSAQSQGHGWRLY
jgi:hypothetical protein